MANSSFAFGTFWIFFKNIFDLWLAESTNAEPQTWRADCIWCLLLRYCQSQMELKWMNLPGDSLAPSLPVVLKLKHALGSSATWTADSVSDSIGLAWGLQFTCLISSGVLLRLMVRHHMLRTTVLNQICVVVKAASAPVFRIYFSFTADSLRTYLPQCLACKWPSNCSEEERQISIIRMPSMNVAGTLLCECREALSHTQKY